jgi:hypothetical protein
MILPAEAVHRGMQDNFQTLPIRSLLQSCVVQIPSGADWFALQTSLDYCCSPTLIRLKTDEQAMPHHGGFQSQSCFACFWHSGGFVNRPAPRARRPKGQGFPP